MKRTISAMLGKGSVNHNSRKFKAENVNGERSYLNIDYCNEPIRKVYHQLFDDALKRYNSKQMRSNRCIADYYEKIRSSKQEKPFYELILRIGNRDDTGVETTIGEKAKVALDEYYQGFQKRNPQLRVFSAHLHMDEATPHLHIDFVPFTTGSKRGLDTRVSLKQALAAQGFQGGTRSETEWNQWVQSEKEQLAIVMERYGFEWEHKDTHEKHLSVLDYKKEVRAEEVAKLEAKISDKKDEFDTLVYRVKNLEKAEQTIGEISQALETEAEYQLPDPTTMMSARSYKAKVVEPLIHRLRSLVKLVLSRYYAAMDNYHKLYETNGRLYRDNEYLRSGNEKLLVENKYLSAQIREYALLHKVFGSKKIDSLLEQAKAVQQSKQRGKHIRNIQDER